MSGRGILIAATSSKSGKTTFTMGLARALADAGHNVRCAKSGPDYIDPGFHAAATGKLCLNLDGWAMSHERLQSNASGDGLLVVEGAMGLFDGAVSGAGSSSDIAKTLGIPVILLIDCQSMSQSIAALASGFLGHDPDLNIAGLVLNNVGSERHETILRAALSQLNTPILAVMRRDKTMTRPSRHLGLVQAGEDHALEDSIAHIARAVAASVDLTQIADLAAPLPETGQPARLAPLGKHIAIADDAAFSFIYPHLLDDWAQQGAHISRFSPLANQPPHQDANAIYLPGGYPELHAHKLTRAGTFRSAMREAAQSGKTIYGECGGYMVLGHSITDKRDIPHPMLGLLDLETCFRKPKLHLGYRQLVSRGGSLSGNFTAHEFHYARTLHMSGEPLFQATDASGCNDTQMGLVSGSVSGSFAHVIDRA